MWFWSNDHEPCHFHVEKTDTWEIRVLFMNCKSDQKLEYELVWGKTPDAKTLQLIHRNVLDHQEDLLDEWNKKVQQD